MSFRVQGLGLHPAYPTPEAASTPFSLPIGHALGSSPHTQSGPFPPPADMLARGSFFKRALARSSLPHRPDSSISAPLLTAGNL